MRYFKVETKAGHVGRSKYVLMTLYTAAESAADASKFARQAPRVKHDHKDAIISVTEVTFKTYVREHAKMYDDVYFQCHDKKTQKAIMPLMEDRIFYEPRFLAEQDKKAAAKERRKSNIYIDSKRIRNKYKYEKMNRMYA